MGVKIREELLITNFIARSVWQNIMPAPKAPDLVFTVKLCIQIRLKIFQHLPTIQNWDSHSIILIYLNLTLLVLYINIYIYIYICIVKYAIKIY